MPLDLKEIARLRNVETVIMTPGNEINLDRAVWNELLDAAKAWELLLHACKSCGSQERLRYGWVVGPSGDLLAHIQHDGRYPTPQAAVLATLGTKGESDAQKD